MIELSRSERMAVYAALVPGFRADRNRYSTAYRGGDSQDALNVDLELGWYDHAAGEGGDCIAFVMRAVECDFRKAVERIESIIGRRLPNGSQPKHSGIGSGLKYVETYQYTDADENVRFEVIRWLKPDGDKTFTQRHPNGGGGWIDNLDGVERVPYRLPKLLKAETVYLCEGEKDAHALEVWGLTASCNPGGSGSSKLYAAWADYFRGRHIVILPDNDKPGRKHAAAVAETLLSVAASLRVVELPDLPEKGDVTDWRNAGGTPEEFYNLVGAAAPLDPASVAELRRRSDSQHTDRGRIERTATEPNPKPIADADAGALVTTRVSEIEAKPVSWLWPRRIARGKVSIIAGNPGLGKSQITASIAAIVTAGGEWPVTRERCEPGDILFLSAEDDPADTLRPRLEAAGASLGRVHVIASVVAGYTTDGTRRDRVFSLEHDLGALSAKLAELSEVSAVIIDPISAYLGDSTDSHKNAEVRALLAPVSELAARCNVAVIAISHLNKTPGGQALMRVTGSLAFVAAARAAWLVARDPKDDSRRLMLSLKNNVAPEGSGLAFRIEAAMVQSTAGEIETSRIAWEPELVTQTADEVTQPGSSQQTSALDDAVAWLEEILADGPIAASEVAERAEAEQFSPITIRRARNKLGIEPKKSGYKNGWTWTLPPKMIRNVEDAHREN